MLKLGKDHIIENMKVRIIIKHLETKEVANGYKEIRNVFDGFYVWYNHNNNCYTTYC